VTTLLGVFKQTVGGAEMSIGLDWIQTTANCVEFGLDPDCKSLQNLVSGLDPDCKSLQNLVSGLDPDCKSLQNLVSGPDLD